VNSAFEERPCSKALRLVLRMGCVCAETLKYSRNKGYSSAHALAVFSFEEFCKSVLLSKKYFAGTGVTKDEYDKIFTKHPAKISFFLEQTADILPKKEDRELTNRILQTDG